jgi:hypothetical protein
LGKPGKTGRKELLMDAKEKLRLMNVIAGKLKSEVVVIDLDIFRKEANIKNKEFYEVEKDAKPKYEIDVTGLTDAEILSSDIIIHIAEKTAERFEDMADTMEITTLKHLVRRLGSADLESVVPMLQTMFLAKGMVDAADELDILELCFRYDEEAYFLFYDVLFDTDIFDWFSIECLIDGVHIEDDGKPN